MKRTIIALVIFLLFVSGITFLFLKDDQNLGDGYYYLSEYEAIDIGYPEGAIIYKSEQKNVFDDVKIKAVVIEAKADKDFILAVQKSVHPKNKKNGLKYYILTKKSDKIYGPYTKSKFQEMRKALTVPQSLHLDYSL